MSRGTPGQEDSTSTPTDASAAGELLGRLAPSTLLAALAATTLDPVYIKDRAGRFVFVNAAALKVTGREEDEVRGRSLDELMPSADAAAIDANERRVFAGETLTIEETALLDGVQRLFVSNKTPLRDAAGAVIGLIGVSSDITLRVQAERDGRRVENELRDSELRFRQLVENLDDVFWVVDWKTGRQRYVSPSYQRCWGFDIEALYAGSARWPERIHPADRARVAQAFAALAGTAPGVDQFAIEYRLLLTDGSERWVRDRGSAIRDSSGAIDSVIGIAEDITDRRTVVHTLRQNSESRRLALRLAKLHFWTIDIASGVVSGEAGLFELWGFAQNQPLPIDAWIDAIHPDDRGPVREAIAAALVGDAEYDIEYRVLRADGRQLWVHSQMTVLRDEAGGPALAYGVSADITERRTTLDRLRAGERNLRTITAAVPIGIVRVGRDLRYQFVNDAQAINLLGGVPENLIGMSLREVLGENAFASLRPHLEAALAGRHVEYEMPLQMPRGYRYIRGTYIPEFDARHEVTGFVGVIEDITERKLAESRLYEREREFKTLVENAPDIIARVDQDLTYLYINRVAGTTFGVRLDRYTGRGGAELGFPAEFVRATSQVLRAGFASGAEQSGSFHVDVGGERAHFVARAVPEFDRIGLVDSMLLIVYDVSARVRAQIERDALLASEHRAREEAEAAARGRDQFLAIVSHELRSPLNGIQSWAHVLEGVFGDAAPVARRAIAGIKTGVDQQVRLIEDLLDATRIMSGKLSLTLAPVKLLPVALEALESVRGKARDKQIEIVTNIEIGDETVDGDSDRLQQIIWNLLSNAIKFTPAEGHVWLTVKREHDNLLILVRDDGRGIAEDFLPHMFERFRRDETGNSRGQDGLGLGLTLVRHLCELHGGSIAAASPGRDLGASFAVRLPLRETAHPAAVERYIGASGLPSLRGLRVMLVDDQAETRDALSVLLQQAGAKTEVCDSGEQAVTRLEQTTAANAPHVLVCDIAMPGQDGYQTIAKIRAREKQDGVPTGGRLPAIALTAFSQREDRIRALTAGFEMHIAKPVALEELIVMIAALAHHHADAARTAETGNPL